MQRLPYASDIQCKVSTNLLYVSSGCSTSGVRNPGSLQVTAPLDFLLELPNLRVLMMGKLEGTWSPQSMAYINDFTKKQLRRNPERDVLLISCPDNILGSLVA